MKNDPIVEEVRQTRERILAECKGDVELLIARLRELSSRPQPARVSIDEVKRRKQSSKPAI